MPPALAPAPASITGDDLLTQNFPMIHAVGRASPRAPRLLDLTWGSTGPHLTLVGKGVCFDTGGLNIKTSGMTLMKKDMGGAATVMGLAQMIMQLDLPIRLRVIVRGGRKRDLGQRAETERYSDLAQGPDGRGERHRCRRPPDSGRCAGLATETPTDALISMATLTGAARTALGPDLAPYYTDDAGDGCRPGIRRRRQL